MSIPFQYREEACYRFISSAFKLEDTVEWMMTQYKDDATIIHAKYPEKLCANTVHDGRQWRPAAAQRRRFRECLPPLCQRDRGPSARGIKG